MTDPNEVNAVLAEYYKGHKDSYLGAFGNEEFCVTCHLPWPCSARRLADALVAARGEATGSVRMRYVVEDFDGVTLWDSDRAYRNTPEITDARPGVDATTCRCGYDAAIADLNNRGQD